MMRSLLKDVRFGLRVLWKSKSFTAVAVLTLALGIGVNTAIFSGVSAFVLRPLPGAGEPERLVTLFERGAQGGGYNNFSYPDFVDYRDGGAPALEGLAAADMAQAAVGEGERGDVVWGQLVSGNFFDVLRVKMAKGRGFSAEEDSTPNTHAVVVLGHNLWRNRFESDPSIVGKTVKLNGNAFTVVGIAPEGFGGSKWALGMEFWVPLMMKQRVTGGTRSWETARGDHWLEVTGRLKEGATAETAAAQLSSVAARIDAEHPAERGGRKRVLVVPEREGRWEDMSGTVRLSSGLALGVVGLVLLIACANVANLMLARSVARRREIGIRLALGAGRWRIVRQLLIESLLLSLAGGCVGLLLSFWMTDALTAFFPSLAYKIVLDVAPDSQALAFTFAVSILTGVVFGLAPAFQASKPDLVPVLKGETGSAGRSRRLSLRNALVVAQVALSLVVLVIAALFVQSFGNAKSIDPGFATEGVVSVAVSPGLFGYTPEQGREFYRLLSERAGAIPGVEAAGVSFMLPLGDSSSWWGPIYRADRPAPPPGEGMDAPIHIVGRGYFDAMKIPLLQGRDFDEHDLPGKKPEAVIVNEAMARKLWPGENPLGRRMMIGRGEQATEMEVVGLARDTKIRTLGEAPRPSFYVSIDQTYNSGAVLVLRTGGDTEAAVAGVRKIVGEMDARMPLHNVKTMEQHLTWAFWAHSMAASLSTAFGLLALVLAATGLYGVVAYSVAQRTREIGIRVALGARAADIVRLVVGQGMGLTLVGLAAGLLAALALARLLMSLLYGVSPADPLTYALVASALALVALLACYLPARRAAKVDPMVALRYE